MKLTTCSVVWGTERAVGGCQWPKLSLEARRTGAFHSAHRCSADCSDRGWVLCWIFEIFDKFRSKYLLL